jgi:small-conductance mechanosensitive channel
VHFNEMYKELAAQLGDVTYKIQALQTEQQRLVDAIKQLDNLARTTHETQKAKAQGSPAGDSSPA